ncbi:ferrochelatase [Aurantivibrio plasticivorans]
MKYQSQAYTHSQSKKVGVLITNLGTPNAPTKSALRDYLKEFLSDPRVVEVPRLIWWCILNLIILNIRPAKSAEAYKRVWTDKGSPLAQITQAQCKAIAKDITDEWGSQVVVEWAMRYGTPSISGQLQKLFDQGVEKLVVLPLYPQYSAATTGSTFDAIAEDFQQRRWLPELRFINQYGDHQGYVEALVRSIQAHWDKFGRAEKLIFSYHGVPLRYLHQGDPYHCQCLKTTRLVAEALGIKENEYMTTFQSRFGKEEWLQPYTDKTLEALPQSGVHSVQIICPGFSADCLETIDEIGFENKEVFIHAGGERYEYIPALNDSDTHIRFLSGLLKQQLVDWIQPEEDGNLREKRYLSSTHNTKSE